jgi:1,4-alpha-glucan branching enzyme
VAQTLRTCYTRPIRLRREREKDLTQNGNISLSDFANGYLYFGLHKTESEWILREWAPNAIEIYLIGSFNNWQRQESYKFKRIENGVWEVRVPLDQFITSTIIKCWLFGRWIG